MHGQCQEIGGKCKGFPDLSKIHKLDKLYWLSTSIALNRNSLIVEHSLFVVSRTEADFDLVVCWLVFNWNSIKAKQTSTYIPHILKMKKGNKESQILRKIMTFAIESNTINTYHDMSNFYVSTNVLEKHKIVMNV